MNENRKGTGRRKSRVLGEESLGREGEQRITFFHRKGESGRGDKHSVGGEEKERLRFLPRSPQKGLLWKNALFHIRKKKTVQKKTPSAGTGRVVFEAPYVKGPAFAGA